MHRGEDDWKALLQQFPRLVPRIEVVTYHQGFNSASKPVLVTCSDNLQYMVKGLMANKTPFTEQVVARLGHLLSAPIPACEIAELGEELRQAQPELQHFLAGPVIAIVKAGQVILENPATP